MYRLNLMKLFFRLIPDYYRSFYSVPEDEHIINGAFFTYGISIGYSYTFVFFKNFFLNLSMIPGAFIQQYDYEYENGEKKQKRSQLCGCVDWHLDLTPIYFMLEWEEFTV